MIDKKEVARIENLAELSLSEGEREEMREDLNEILNHFEKLQELDTEEVDPLMHILNLKNVLREDSPRETVSREEALKNAPARKGKFFQVPAVIQEEEKEE